jgi:hypothetical protein
LGAFSARRTLRIIKFIVLGAWLLLEGLLSCVLQLHLDLLDLTQFFLHLTDQVLVLLLFVN